MTTLSALVPKAGRSKPSLPLPSGRHNVTATTLRRWRYSVFVAVFGATLLQLVLRFDTATLITSTFALAGNALGYGYTLRQYSMRRYPISSLILLGYTFSYFTLPPLGQLFGLHTITYHLYYPVLDLAYALVGLLALIGGHLLYRQLPLFSSLQGLLRKQIYRRMGFYRTPSLLQLWLMGLVGCLAIVTTKNYGLHQAGIYHAVMQGLRPFVYVPYVTILLPAWSPPRKVPRLNRLWLILYTVVLLVLALIVNSRAYLLMGFASLLIVYFFLLATGRMPLPKVRARTVLLVLLAMFIIVGPVSRLAMSMVLVRGQRAHVTPTQLVVKTWDTFLSAHVAERYEKLSAAISGGRGINELYFDNLYLNRLGNLKFEDNAIIDKRALSASGAKYFTRIEVQKIFSVLPSPLLHLLSLSADANKRTVTSGSSGDFLLFAVTQNPYAIGGFRTGSLLVNLSIVFGYLWPLILSLCSSLVFLVVDAWCWMIRDGKTGLLVGRFNPLVIGMLFSETFFFTGAATGTESIAGIMELLLRGWVQVAVLYAIVFWTTRLLTHWERL